MFNSIMNNSPIQHETQKHIPPTTWELQTASGAQFNWDCDKPPEQSHSQNELEDLCRYQRNQGPTLDHDLESKAQNRYHEGNYPPKLFSDHDPTEDIKQDILDLAGGLAPLEIRQLPDLTHGIGTWNVCNGFEAETIATITKM
jgi:hypothetical protein